MLFRSVGRTALSKLLHQLGYSLQANAKVKEGARHPSRDEQFHFISETTQAFLERGQPVISVDTKKKEFLGERGSPGREWRPKGKPIEVKTYDFVSEGEPVAIPYGVYDVGANRGFVNVGADHNTPRFATRSIAKWWRRMGKRRYPSATELLITADSGGANSARSKVFKVELQRFADATGLTIHVSHFPPGTSKWNKIEHRLFSFVSMNWRATPLTSYETIVSLIGQTTTSKGLKVIAQLDKSQYPLGEKVAAGVLATLAIQRNPKLGQWNYSIRPRSAEERRRARLTVLASAPVTREQRNARWRSLIHEHKLSGLTAPDFCEKKGISVSGYARARRRLGAARVLSAVRSRWAEVIQQQQESGLTVRAFCAQRRISRTAFARARSRQIARLTRTGD